MREHGVHVGIGQVSYRRALHRGRGPRRLFGRGRSPLFEQAAAQRSSDANHDSRLVHAFYSAGVLQYCQPMRATHLLVFAAKQQHSECRPTRRSRALSTRRSPRCPASRSGTITHWRSGRPAARSCWPRPAPRPPWTCGAPLRRRAKRICSIRSTPCRSRTPSCCRAAAPSVSTARRASCAIWKRRRSALPFGHAHVPIVPAAALFDLSVGDGPIGRAPTAATGRPPRRRTSPVVEGSVGAGAGATIGKAERRRARDEGRHRQRLARAAQRHHRLRAGGRQRVWRRHRPRDRHRSWPACARRTAGRSPMRGRCCGPAPSASAASAQNTTLGVVATNARLTKTEAKRVAQMAHDGFARAIAPVHTPVDGDTIFVLATGLDTGSARCRADRRARRRRHGRGDRARRAAGHRRLRATPPFATSGN